MSHSAGGLTALGAVAAMTSWSACARPIGRVEQDIVCGAIEARRRGTITPASSKLTEAVRQFTSKKPASWSNAPQARSTIGSRLHWRTVKCLGELLQALRVDTPLREAGPGKDYWSTHGTGAAAPRTATTPSSRRRHAGSSGGCASAGMPPSPSPAGHRPRRLSAWAHRPIGRTSATEERHSGPPVWMNWFQAILTAIPHSTGCMPQSRSAVRRGNVLLVTPTLGRGFPRSHGPPNQGSIENS
jgi:hypothetical protein